MTEKETIQNFADMVEATRKLTKPWIIALIATNALWAIVTFALIWFAYMAPVDVDFEQAQDFSNQTQTQEYNHGATQGG